MSKPTLYLSNFASRRTPGHHGPGRLFTIMAKPRFFERGEGRVLSLEPELEALEAYKRGDLCFAEYRERYEQGLRGRADALGLDLVPGQLGCEAHPPEPIWHDLVRNGDTLCCCCSRAAAVDSRCHRVWAARFLVKAGWRVILDGKEVQGA